jgi:iron complex outermembrane receptor protein
MKAMKSRRSVSYKALLLAGLTLVVPSIGRAQDAQEPEAATSLDEIVVTAERRETRLQDTPIAVTAVTGEALERRGAADLIALASIAPNVQIQGSAPLSGGSFNATVFIRGIGQNDASIFNDPGVGIYLDGVYIGRTTGSILELADIERAEVLRGPQGTLFGKNAVGGAINVVSRRPSAEPEAEISATVGTFDRADIAGIVSGPLIPDRLFGRLNVGYFSRDGYVTRLTDGADLGDKNLLGARAAFAFDASPDLTFDLSLDATRVRQNSGPLTLLYVAPTGAPFLNQFNSVVTPTTGIVAPNGLATLNDSFVTGDPFTTWQSGPNYNDLDQFGAGLTTSWRLSDTLSAKSITAYRTLQSAFGRDGDNTPYDFRHTQDKVDQSQFSQEFQLLGESFSGRLNWVAGAYFMREIAENDAMITLASGVYDPILRPNTALELVFSQYNKIDTRSYALFGQATYDLTEQLSLTLGLRYTEEKKIFQVVEQRVVSGTYIVDPDVLRVLYGEYPLNGAWDDVSPRFGLNYKFTDRVLGYVTVTKGFKSGSFNGRATGSSADVVPFDPETVWNYEAGLKTELLDRRLILNLAAYRMDYDDIQVTVNRTPQNYVANAAAARLQGIEIEFRAAPTAALRIDGAIGYLDAAYTEVGGTGLTLPITLNSHLIRTPDLTANLGADYTWSIGGGDLVLRADYSYTSRQFFDAENNPRISQGGYGLVNARLTYAPSDAAWSAAAFVTNLTDEVYLISGNAGSAAFGSITEGSYGRPREYGFTLRRRF